jgi:hypothetical protein
MHVKEFERKLKLLNQNLSIFYGVDEYKPAGIWLRAATCEGGEYQSICGIDKGWLPEHPITGQDGRIIKGGWRRAIAILCNLKIIDPQKSYKYFGHWMEHRVPQSDLPQGSAVDQEIQRAQEKGYFKKDELVDIGREINKHKPTRI